MVFAPGPDGKEDGRNGPYLVIQGRCALQVERPNAVQTWRWGNGRLESRPPRVRNLFGCVQLARIPEVAFAEAALCVRGVSRFLLECSVLARPHAGEVFVREPGGKR